MKYNYINDNGQPAPNWLQTKRGLVNNPTEEELLSAGYHKVTQPTEEEIRLQDLSNEKDNLIQMLKDTDYKAIKHSEGWLSDNEYVGIKLERQKWRDRINQIEIELNQ